jgi:LPS O-antigen subunit length determinant protein (WzzB/FepE family)
MNVLQQRIAVVTHTTANLIAQLRELDRLRERVSKAKLSALRSRLIDRRKRTRI